MARKLFGTDGVRGVAGEFLTAELALALERAATRQHRRRAPAGADRARHARVGRDAAGSARRRGERGRRRRAARRRAADAGGAAADRTLRLRPRGRAVGLAQPLPDNGIKFFAGDGYKLSDEAELAIERELALGERSQGGDARGSGARGAARAAIGRIRELRGAPEDYLRELHVRFVELDLDGLDVLLDCANGATYRVAPGDLQAPGREGVRVMADAPDGRNINAGCGSTHVRRAGRARCARAATRGLRVRRRRRSRAGGGPSGAIVDGDELMALATLHLRASGRLRGNGVAVTVMTNYGFHAAMEREGVAVGTTKVGDRYVLEELRARGWTLGGEQSGHIIDMGFNRTGDGIASALLTLEALAGRDLSERDAMAQAAAAARQRARARPRRAGAGAGGRRGGARRRARARRARGACSCARAAPSRSCG